MNACELFLKNKKNKTMSALEQTTPKPEMSAKLNPEAEQLDEVLLDILFSSAEKFVIEKNLTPCP